MTTERAKLLDNIISDLLGTCQSLEKVSQDWEAGELSIDDLAYIESEIFLCDNCGWWCETCEAHDSWFGEVCDDCYREDDEEEDEDW